MSIPKPKVLIVGAGNPFAGDDAIGIKVVEELSNNTLPEGVKKVIIENKGLMALDEFQSAEKIIFVDAGDISASPGEWKIVESSHLNPASSLFSHSVGIVDLIYALMLTSEKPPRIYLFLIQPSTYNFGEKMSGEVKRNLKRYVHELSEFVNKLSLEEN